MADCRKCEYYKLRWEDVTNIVVKIAMKCELNDNPVTLKSFYNECKYFKRKKVK